MKKALALLLALVLCLGVLAGCQEDPVATTTQPSSSAGDTTETPTEPPAYSFEGKKLDILTGLDINDHDLDKWIQEDLGLDITVSALPENETAVLTEKVTPSLWFQWGPNSGHTYGRYGAYVNLYDYKDWLPDFFARYEQFGDEIKAAYETAPGELYSAPIFLNGDVQHYAWFYREDVFKALNLATPTTWDEFLAVCKALKEKYPDSYPFTARNLNNAMNFFNEFAQQFGVDYNGNGIAFDAATGKYYNPYTTKEAKVMLEKMRELITLGYMDVASLSYETAKWTEALTTGKSFITYDKAFMLTNLEKAGQEANSEFVLGWFHPFKAVETTMDPACHYTSDYSTSYAWAVTTKCADLELAIRYLNWLYSDEGSLMMSWGKEGKSYEVDADGNKKFIEGYDATKFARYQVSGWIDMTATASTYSAHTQEMIFDTMENSKTGAVAYPSLKQTDEENTILETYWTDWYNEKNTSYQNFLLGKVELNGTNWDAFVKRMTAYGEAEQLKCYQDAYARYLAE